jgi:hypothetical protein
VAGVYWNLLKTKQLKSYQLIQWKLEYPEKNTAGTAKSFVVVISLGDKL